MDIKTQIMINKLKLIKNDTKSKIDSYRKQLNDKPTPSLLTMIERLEWELRIFNELLTDIQNMELL